MTAAPTAAQRVMLDRQTLVRLRRVIRDFAGSEVGGRAAVMAGLLLALLLSINGLNVINSYVGRDFMTAIERRDGAVFIDQALRYAAVFAASTLAAVVYRFTEERLGLLWREWFTRRLVGRYLDRHLYYELNVADGLANPDQRIADDVRAFTTTTLSLALIFLNGTLTLIAFSGVLWSISRALFATAVIYAVVGSLVAYAIGRPLVRLNYDQSDLEADFRAQLIHVRENAESIGLLGSEPHLAARLFDQIGAFAGNFKRIIAVNRNLSFFTTGYNYMIQLIPALVVAPLFIRGSAEFGVIPQSAMAFAQVIGAFSLIVNQFPQLSSYAAVLARLNALGEAYQAIDERPAGGIVVVEDDSRLALEQVTLFAPHDHRALVRELSLEMSAGGRLRVEVPDDQVTSALLHAAAGLWRTGTGRIVRPRPGGLLLLPDRPYLPPGTLRQLLSADGAQDRTQDDRLWEILRGLGAEGMVQRVGGLDVHDNWNLVLSIDEQRLVGAAHLVLAVPRFAMLANPLASLGAQHCAYVLAALMERGVGCVVIGTDASPLEGFDAVVEIAPDGAWTRVG